MVKNKPRFVSETWTCSFALFDPPGPSASFEVYQKELKNLYFSTATSYGMSNFLGPQQQSFGRPPFGCIKFGQLFTMRRSVVETFEFQFAWTRQEVCLH